MLVLVPASLFEELRGPAADRVPGIRLAPYEEDASVPVPDAAEADAVLRWVAGKRYAPLVTEGPKVRWLHTASAGVDHVLTPEVKAKPGLIVSDSGPAFGIALSEFVLAWMLMVNRRLTDILAQQRTHEWKWVTQQEMYGQTVGIVGLGPIGLGIASRCKAFGMRTLGLRRQPQSVADIDTVLTGSDGLRTLLAESDWVILAAALTSETRSLIGAVELAQMKPTAHLINIARGGVVDEPALIQALQNGTIAGACLDVFAKEPLPTDSPLWDMPNVFISPHTSPGWTIGLRERQKEIFLSNLQRFAQGETLEGVVDIERGY